MRDYFGSMRAMAVHNRHVNDFIAMMKAEGKRNATINRSLQLLGQAYRIAVASDPPLLSRPLKVPNVDQADNVRKGKFTNDEAEAIFAGSPDYMAGVARFAYETGARAEEILKLQWSYFRPRCDLDPGDGHQEPEAPKHRDDSAIGGNHQSPEESSQTGLRFYLSQRRACDPGLPEVLA